MAYPRLGQGIAHTQPTILTAAPGRSTAGSGVLTQSQVFGPRPGGNDGLRQDHIYGYYRAAMTSPGSADSTRAVVTLWAIANATVDPGQPQEGKQNNPKATRDDARAALGKLQAQGWTAIGPAPVYPVSTMTTARPTPPTPSTGPTRTLPTSTGTPRQAMKPTVSVFKTAGPGQLQPGGPDAYVNYLPPHFPGADILMTGMVDHSDLLSGGGAAAPAATGDSGAGDGGTGASADVSATGDGSSATVTATATAPPWGWILGGFAALGLGAALLTRKRRAA